MNEYKERQTRGKRYTNTTNTNTNTDTIFTFPYIAQANRTEPKLSSTEQSDMERTKWQNTHTSHRFSSLLKRTSLKTSVNKRFKCVIESERNQFPMCLTFYSHKSIECLCVCVLLMFTVFNSCNPVAGSHLFKTQMNTYHTSYVYIYIYHHVWMYRTQCMSCGCCGAINEWLCFVILWILNNNSRRWFCGIRIKCRKSV